MMLSIRDIKTWVLDQIATQATTTASNLSTHAGLTTGVHGVGAGTIAKTADITATKLDDLSAPDNNTDLNVSTTAHGLTPKLPNDATKYLNGTGAYTVPTAVLG